MGEADELIKRTYWNAATYQVEVQDGYGYKVLLLSKGIGLAVAFDGDRVNGQISGQSIVKRIYLRPYVIDGNSIKQPSVPDLYDWLGDAENVRLITGIENARFTLLYKEQRILVFMDDLYCDRVLINQYIMTIMLQDQEPLTGVAWLSQPEGWRGFGRCYHFERMLFP